MRRKADWKAATRTTPAGWPAAIAATSASAASIPSSSDGRVPDQCAAGVGESDVPAGAFEQLRACLAFEHRELLGDRTRRVAEGPGGAVNSSASVEFAE